jgi:RHS repeat-associated protein
MELRKPITYPCKTAGEAGAPFDVDAAGPRVTSRTISNGTQSSPWTYYYACGTNGANTVVDQTKVTSPIGDDTVHTFTTYIDDNLQLLNNGLPPSHETQTDYYSGPQGGTAMKSVKTTYQAKSVGPHLPLSVTTSWLKQGNLVSYTETAWDSVTNPIGVNSYGSDFPNLSWGNPLTKKEYAFGVGAHGTQVRETDFNYLHLTNTTYQNLNIANRPTSKIVYNSGGSAAAKTTYGYDETTISSTSSNPVPNHDYTNYGSGFKYRGNPTTVSVCPNAQSCTALSTTHAYNDLGHVTATTDPDSHTTSFSYADSWSGSGCGLTSSSNTQAFLTLTTPPATNTQHRTTAKYFPCTGQVEATQDENDILANRTGTAYSYDLMLRPTGVNYPDGGQTSYSYSDRSTPVSITSTQTINSSYNRVTVSNRDGLGREYQSQVTSDPEGTDTVDTSYDLLGRKATVSNPHRSGSTSTDGTTTYQYDALNRVTLEIPPDGSSSSNNVATTYGAQTTGTLCLTTTVTDQAGKKRMSCSDALGHMVEVVEYTSPTNFETDYSYDVLDNVLSVTQKGDNANNARTRTFIYDSLSRLTNSANPESGTITYSYTNGTALCAGDLSAVCSKTAPAPNQSSGTVTTTYSYDVLNRLTQKSYSDTSTPTTMFGYDQSSITIHNDQFNISNSVGRLSWAAPVNTSLNPINMNAYSYDPMGRVIGMWDSPDGLMDPKFVYTYNLDGSPATLTYPSGRVLTYTVKGAGRVTDVKDVTNGFNYATGATYAPPGELAGVVNGSSSVGITTTDAYNKRLQPGTFTVATNGSGTHTIFSRTYDFGLGTTDNGVVNQITNGLDGNRTQNFTYDSLNRIKQANTTGANWGETYTVDAWGNLTGRGAVSGKTNYEPLNAAVDTNNRVIGLGYDIAGNLTSNGSATFTYDDENRLVHTGGYTYTYDASGQRITKMVQPVTPGTFYLRGAGGQTLAETDASGLLLNEYIFFNGQRVARQDANGVVHYYFPDHLGSASLITDASGTVQKEVDYYPYGGEIVISGNDPNHYKFTGKERDETGLDEFGARYYSSQMGRFMTPDWGSIPMAVPYAVLGNPQTLNLYSYVENNPATGTDPDGHMPPDGLYHGDPFGGGGSGPDASLVEQSFPQAKPQMMDYSWLVPAGLLAQMTAQNQSQAQTTQTQTQNTSNQQGHWEYSQSTGQMTHVLPDGTKQVGGTGYSGKDEGLNNPKAQDKPNVGPIPQGDWKIEPQKDNVTGQGHKLPASMRLDPSKNTETFGRSGFLIHGDNSQQNHSASNGCIILDRPTRNQIGGSGDNNLTVVP